MADDDAERHEQVKKAVAENEETLSEGPVTDDNDGKTVKNDSRGENS